MVQSNPLQHDATDGAMITAGSHSRLATYESCPFRAKLAYVDKVPEPTPPDSKETPLDRGSHIHDAAEAYCRGKQDLVEELFNFKPEFRRLRELTRSRKTELEQSWEYDDAWQPLAPFAYPKGRRWTAAETAAFRQIWLRIKLDAVVWLSPTEIVAIDYKTGKRYGNEIKHAEQLNLYTVGTLIKYPKVQHVHTELWYLDQDELTGLSFTRKQGLRFLAGFNQRLLKMTTATDFPARPSNHTCRFCPYKTGLIGKYGPQGTGHCDKNPV